MNIPDIVRINGVDYTVQITPDTLIHDGNECVGIVDYNFHIIKINSKLTDQQDKERTFLHELFHAIIDERSLDIEAKEINEEIVVEELAKGLYQVIRDNPKMFNMHDVSVDSNISTDIDKVAGCLANNLKNSLIKS